MYLYLYHNHCATFNALDGCVQVTSRVFRPGGKFRFAWQPESHRVYYGSAVDGDEHLIDEVRGEDGGRTPH